MCIRDRWDSNLIRHTRAVYRAADRWFAEVWQGQPDAVVLERRAGRRRQMSLFAREQQDATPYQFQHGVTYEPTEGCLLYTSYAADDRSSVHLGGSRIIKNKKSPNRVSVGLV
mgnify:CR=1 FL=1